MSHNSGAFLVLVALSLAVPTVLFFLLHDSLRELLEHTVKQPGGVIFYLRSFLAVLFLSALSAAVGISFDLPADTRFMQFAWKVGEGLSSTMQLTLVSLSLYVVVMTILIATLKIKNDK